MDPIAVLALIFSLLSLVVTLIFERRRMTDELQFQQLQQQSDRDSAIEARLADWPDAFRFHGVNIDEAITNNISANQITYLVLSINVMTVECDIRGVSAYAFLVASDYRQLMFSQEITRQTWKYARSCISKKWRSDIDRFLLEKYQVKYEELD